jgi:mxaJ protein
VFVTRAGRTPPVRSFDDPALRKLRIGVHFTGAGGNPPPAAALVRRGLTANLVSFSIYGDYRRPDPPARLLEAVAGGQVDVAVAWGPLAGWYAARSRAPLRVAPVPEEESLPGAPMTFAIALGVRKGDTARRDALQGALDRQAPAIRGILRRYGVPLLDEPAGGSR